MMCETEHMKEQEMQDKKKVQEQVERLREIEDNIAELEQQQSQEDTYQDERKCYVGRFEGQIQEAEKYYIGQEASGYFSNINQKIACQKKQIIDESNFKYHERKEKINQLRRLREEA